MPLNDCIIKISIDKNFNCRQDTFYVSLDRERSVKVKIAKNGKFLVILVTMNFVLTYVGVGEKSDTAIRHAFI